MTFQERRTMDELSLDEILEAYALEEVHDKAMLASYLAKYPQYAEILVDLTRELSRIPVDRELTAEDKELIQKAWERYSGRFRKKEAAALGPCTHCGVNPAAEINYDGTVKLCTACAGLRANEDWKLPSGTHQEGENCERFHGH